MISDENIKINHIRGKPGVLVYISHHSWFMFQNNFFLVQWPAELLQHRASSSKFDVKEKQIESSLLPGEQNRSYSTAVGRA